MISSHRFVHDGVKARFCNSAPDAVFSEI